MTATLHLLPAYAAAGTCYSVGQRASVLPQTSPKPPHRSRVKPQSSGDAFASCGCCSKFSQGQRPKQDAFAILESWRAKVPERSPGLTSRWRQGPVPSGGSGGRSSSGPFPAAWRRRLVAPSLASLPCSVSSDPPVSLFHRPGFLR